MDEIVKRLLADVLVHATQSRVRGFLASFGEVRLWELLGPCTRRSQRLS